MNPSKIFNVDQIRKLDAYTIAHEPIASIDLMERASMSFVNWFIEKFDSSAVIRIYAGLGNNGGDGLGIARLLSEKKYRVEVFVIWHAENTTADFAVNYSRLPSSVEKRDIRSISEIPVTEKNPIDKNTILIDALLGSGLSRKPEGLLEQVIAHINQSGLRIISVDIASGLFADRHTEHTSVVNPDFTVTFQMPKLAFLLPENSSRVGEWNAVDIGLSPQFISLEKTDKYYLDINFIKSIYKKREKFSHKGTFGKALLVAGSLGKMGAAVLAAKGCLRSGVGLLTVHVPKCGIEILQTSVPEAMVISGNSKNQIASVNWKSLQPDAIGIGPGIGKNTKTRKYFQNLLQTYKSPMVIDADALNLLSENPELLNSIPPNSILTPHVREFERLTGKAKNDFDRLEQLINFAKDRKVYMILKGNHTAIATPDGELYFNSTGNPGMATGGSGDVLTGILASLLAQRYSPLDASMLGVYIHGLAGDFAASELSQESLIASDLVTYLGNVFLFLVRL